MMRSELPRLKARTAGVLYVLSVLVALLGESFARGSLAFAVGLIAILCYIAVRLLLYDIFKPVNNGLALLALFFGLIVGMCEALRWHPGGVNVALVFHGCYCLLTGYLIFRSTFLPRGLGVLMAFGGLSWLSNVSPELADDLSPYNVAAGFFGEGLVMLWLLVVGVNVQRWKEQAGTAAA
jgi:Domain of unknown function (DUF4386)